MVRHVEQLRDNDTGPKTGIMIRANDTGGSPYGGLVFTTSTLAFQYRDEQDGDSVRQSGASVREFPQYIRLQRVGNQISGFVSKDGRLWRPVATPPRTINMPASALFGIAVSSRNDGVITTATFDNVAVLPGVVSPPGLSACGGDKSVLLTWSPLPNVAGYNIYRGAADATFDKLAKVNAEPVNATSFTDTSAGLTNGTPQVYAVVPVVKAADGTLTESAAATATSATPVLAPAGFTGCSISEGTLSGSVAFDAATGEITIRGSGGDIWDAADRFYFVSQAVEGDVQVTVKALSKPTHTNDWAKAGLMIRESLDAGSRNTYLVLTPANGLAFQWRGATNANAEWGGSSAIDTDTLTTPIVIRLTRKGNVITPEYSTDDGKTFQSAGDPYTFEQALSKTVYVGLCITAHDAAQISEAKFSGLDVKKL